MTQIPLSSIRREYGTCALLENNIAPDPITQFNIWFDEIFSKELEPTAMTLATVDASGMPDVRIVLLKGIQKEKFIFYTHYDSAKGQELAHNPKAALNFFWRESIRQVKIRGVAHKVSEQASDEYFASRPRLSQLSAAASHQSHLLASRSVLEDKITEIEQRYKPDQPIQRPQQWGGYAISPLEIEFWQGRDNRLHDRIRYRKENMHWIIERLSP